MAKLRVTCPACETELEIDAKFEGEEVECGNCLEVFTVREPPAHKAVLVLTIPIENKKDKRKPKTRRREDDDEDYAPPPPRPTSSDGTGLGVTALILGLLSVAPGCCCGLFAAPLSIGAIVTGAIGLNRPAGKGLAITGIIFGTLSLCLLGLRYALGFGLLMNNVQQFR